MSSRALRKQQNDAELLESILNSNATTKRTTQQQKPKANMATTNIYSLMDDNNSDDSEDVKDDAEEFELHKDVADEDNEAIAAPKIQLASKKSRKKANKGRKNKKKDNKPVNEPQSDTKDDIGNDEELDKIIREFQKSYINTTNLLHDDDIDGDEFVTASESESYDEGTRSSTKKTSNHNLFTDSGFSHFNKRGLKACERFFNTDIRKLDPHTEYKLLFDDISAKSLEDIDSVSSVSISPQQLKQIQRLKRMVKNWGGRDRRTVPNGPGNSPHRLRLTKVRDDWIPTQRGEFKMALMTKSEVMDWQLWMSPLDWKDVVEERVGSLHKFISFYKFESVTPDITRKSLSEFYVSVILHPDHEALISLISSRYPYLVPGLLQVALIAIRQGDRSNTNGLLQRALFVFDRALKTTVQFDGIKCQLPYIYFMNRQFYLTIFRYIQALGQRGAVGTASEWTKVLWSLSPLEDPLGCRYFIDHYLLLNEEYQYIIDVAKSPLFTTYKQWYTLGFSLAVTLSLIRLGKLKEARQEIEKNAKINTACLMTLFLEHLKGDVSQVQTTIEPTERDILEFKSYVTRFQHHWKSTEEVNFLHDELSRIFTNSIDLDSDLDNAATNDDVESPFYIDGIPINLLRFAILSEESSLMAAIPKRIWSNYEIYEFDVLPPIPTTKESRDVIENIKSLINESELISSQAEALQNEEILRRIQQLSLQEYMEGNPQELDI